MTSNERTDVFGEILDRVDAEIDQINDTGAQALGSGDYDTARSAIERGKQFVAVRAWLSALRGEWLPPTPQPRVSEESEELRQRRNLGRLPAGASTSREAYFLPILSVLIEMGGRGRTDQVLDRVGEVMKKELQEEDFELLPGEPVMPRWRKNAAWARYSMVREGFLRDDSPRSYWEITDTGRQFLLDQNETGRSS